MIACSLDLERTLWGRMVRVYDGSRLVYAGVVCDRMNRRWHSVCGPECVQPCRFNRGLDVWLPTKAEADEWGVKRGVTVMVEVTR